MSEGREGGREGEAEEVQWKSVSGEEGKGINTWITERYSDDCFGNCHVLCCCVIRIEIREDAEKAVYVRVQNK